MTSLEMILILFSGSLLAGLIGALSGLGGGMIVVPLLTLALGVDIHYAIGASLIAIIATSSGSSSAYVRDGYSNIRVGLLLETATTIGAICGVVIGTQLSPSVLYILFGCILIYCVFSSLLSSPYHMQEALPDKLSSTFKLDSQYPSQNGYQSYHVQHLPLGYAMMFIAGNVSGILGIGSGAIKVLALDKIMKLPFKVSTTTSNFMIGVTAAASAGIYLKLGYIDPILTMPVMLGVTVGAILGARLLPSIKTNTLRHLFNCSIGIIGIQMIYAGIF